MVTDSHSPSRRPTMTDVAQRAGVSLKTVSRVVNGVQTVDPEMAGRVQEAADELGYRPNFAAAVLRSGARTATIGLLIKDLRNEFYATIAAAVADVARANGFQLITSYSGENADDELEAVQDLCRRRVDGLLIVPTSGDHAGLQKERDLGTPMVFLDRRPEGLDADAVVLDNFAGARAGTGMLLDEGHTRIGILIDTLRMPTMGERLNGVRQAYTDRGLSFDESLVVHNVATPDKAAKRMETILAAEQAPTAFFCGNNRSGVGALRTLWAHGRTEPLVCFDDFHLSDLMPRPVTVIGYDNYALGALGAELLFRRIRGEDFESQTVVLPTRLIRRGTTTDAPHPTSPVNQPTEGIQ
ncbi:LacI family transcriptional regulator [Arthrobacter sp. UYP6]|uniref:LacI family DNA-binding transcriptional regulator n=1 Tax=Arthrobacter sp. UYP6 TaxID=1756378 RepID=UPI003396518C